MAVSYHGSILWIDDDIGDSSPEVISLRRDGFEVHCAVTAELAAAMTYQRTYELLLLDLRLPDGDGIALLEKLCPFDTPIVILTGYPDVESAVRALKMGVKDFLSKPIDVETLSSTIVQLISTRCGDVESERRTRWLRSETERLTHCRTRLDVIHLIIRMLLDRRLALRHFPGCAAALRLALKDPSTKTQTDGWLRTTANEISVFLRQGLDQPWPTNHRLVEALARIELEGRKESQVSLAQRLGFSRAHLSRIVSGETHRPPSQWALFAAALAAFRDVVESTEAISQIAYARGWHHHSQFDDDFFRLFGASPTSIRHLIAQLSSGDDSQST